MKKLPVLSIVMFFMGGFGLCAQDTISNGKALNFPVRKYGISIGNSHEFTGIRINFTDKNVKRINGLNVTLWFKKEKNQNAVENGINVGVIPAAGTMQPINLGLLCLNAEKKLNGLSICGLIVGSAGSIKGLCVSGLATMVNGNESVISGIAISGIAVGAGKAINGLAIGGLAAGADENVNGVAASLAFIRSGNTFQGIAVTGGYLTSEMFKGLAIVGFANSSQMHGLSIALFNRAKELHGVQLGLLNYAGNNRKGLRMLPFVNMHLKKANKVIS